MQYILDQAEIDALKNPLRAGELAEEAFQTFLLRLSNEIPTAAEQINDFRLGETDFPVKARIVNALRAAIAKSAADLFPSTQIDKTNMNRKTETHG